MSDIDQLFSSWTKLGVDLAVSASQRTPDIERVIIATAELMPESPRLYPIAFSWLCMYQSLVARHRLARLANEIGDREHSAMLGLLLDSVRQQTGSPHLLLPIRRCRRLRTPLALLIAERSRAYRPIAEKEASRISRKWGVLAPMPEIKTDSIRPIKWMLSENPSLKLRAILGGNLAASILAVISSDPATSESALARSCGATRKAVREALAYLGFCGLVERLPDPRGSTIALRHDFELRAARVG